MQMSVYSRNQKNVGHCWGEPEHASAYTCLLTLTKMMQQKSAQSIQSKVAHSKLRLVTLGIQIHAGHQASLEACSLQKMSGELQMSAWHVEDSLQLCIHLCLDQMLMHPGCSV